MKHTEWTDAYAVLRVNLTNGGWVKNSEPVPCKVRFSYRASPDGLCVNIELDRNISITSKFEGEADFRLYERDSNLLLYSFRDPQWPRLLKVGDSVAIAGGH